MQYYRSGFTHAHQRERATSFDLLAAVMLTQPRLQATFCVKRCRWLMVIFVVRHDSQGLSFKVVFQPVSPTLYQCMRLFHFTRRTLHLTLTAKPFLQPTKKPLNSSPAHYHLLKAQQISHLCLIIQFIKTVLHRISLRTDPQRSWLVGSCQMDFVPSVPLRPERHA